MDAVLDPLMVLAAELPAPDAASVSPPPEESPNAAETATDVAVMLCS